MSIAKPRILIANAFFDEARVPTRRPTTFLKSSAPAYLAGAFRPERFDIRLWDEATQGPLLSPSAFDQLDMLVLTGLSSAFDRMLHLTAYAKTRSPGVAVAAGGPAVRAIPAFARQFFDYAAEGDVEEMIAIGADVFGHDAVRPHLVPRFDLTSWFGRFGHVETSRNCNFACSFCSLTAEARPYRRLDTTSVARHLDAAGDVKFMVFNDNNFFGNNRADYDAKIKLINDRHRQGQIPAWGALVTSDFFADTQRITDAQSAGCQVLFCGVESFSDEANRRFGKLQNTTAPAVDRIRRTLDAGVLFLYGLVVDAGTRTLADIRAELDDVMHRDDITLPTFVVLPIPYPGTPFLHELAENDRLLPHTRLRDLDGSTIAFETRDALPDVAKFMANIGRRRGYRRRILRQLARFVKRYRRILPPKMLAALTARTLASLGPDLRRSLRPARRTHISTTEPLDKLYRPAFTVERQFESHFQPTYLTDETGRLTDLFAASVTASGGSSTKTASPSAS